MCDLKNLKEMEKEELLHRISRIVALQEAVGFQPHIVILCHSWEFFNPPATHRDYDYCSHENFEFLRNVNRILAERFRVGYVSMTALGRQFKEKIPSA
jgi:hypothetical protein